MTNPFPTSFSGGVIQDPGFGGALSSSIAGILAAMQEREKLERERAEFQSKQEYFKTLDTGNKLDNERKKSELAADKRKLEAKGQGLDAYSQWVGSGAKQESLGGILARIKDPDTAQDFVDRVTKHREQENQAAIAQANAVQAEVAQATKEDAKARSKTDTQASANQATISGAQARQAETQEAARTQNLQLEGQKLLADLTAPQQQGVDPSQVNAAVNLYRSGGTTLGEAFKTAGVPLPAGADPNKKFEVQTRGMAIRKAEQKTAAAQSLISNSQIEELLTAGTKITVKTRLMDAIPFDAGQGQIAEPQQQLLAAGGAFVSQYVLSISGKAATDKEREFIMKQILPRANDREGTIRQKQLMRESMVQIMFDASQGAERPLSDVIESIIGAAKAKGADGFQLQFLKESQRKAKLMEAQAKMLGPNDVPDMTAGPEPAGPDSLQAFLNAY